MMGNQPMSVVEHDLSHAAMEENLAARAYRQRAATARSLGYLEAADLFEHIAQEEDVHEKEFTEKLDNLRQAARDISYKVVGHAF